VKQGRTARKQQAGMERADWLEGGFDSARARFLMMTVITRGFLMSAARRSLPQTGRSRD
jgi:hypothetical protein